MSFKFALAKRTTSYFLSVIKVLFLKNPQIFKCSCGRTKRAPCVITLLHFQKNLTFRFALSVKGSRVRFELARLLVKLEVNLRALVIATRPNCRHVVKFADFNEAIYLIRSNVDHYCVPSRRSREALEVEGVSKMYIRMSGMVYLNYGRHARSDISIVVSL